MSYLSTVDLRMSLSTT